MNSGVFPMQGSLTQMDTLFTEDKQDPDPILTGGEPIVIGAELGVKSTGNVDVKGPP